MSGEFIRVIRTTHHLSVRDFAKRIQVSPSLVSRLEGGGRNVTKRIEGRVIGAFGICEDKLASINLLINEIKN
ncbi:helix-turn-helix transcriptional regulator [Bacillus sp. ISL-37]|uniref:helix-turn-helix domain-containing protein n=1 Tax=Bacillus sp. ISL-37 TaxID=2819123 RepID=UPI001BE8E6F2|nr:helix-turn-helix transcriptional regulator [Bacillus sp. ISL-37]MBT2682642.1 helix-turn-helix domain-containing protein [Bacillus sp. ISL-37]